MERESILRQYQKTKDGKEKGKGIHHPLLAIDVENDTDTGKFICAGVYGEIKRKVKGQKDIKKVEEYFDSHDELCKFLSKLKKNSCILTFFNLSYDKVFLNEIINHKRVLRNGSRIISCRLKDNDILLMDMANHVDGRLEDWMGYLDMERKHGVSKKDLSDLKDRVMNDAKATYHLSTFIEDFYHGECKIPLKLTVSSNALLLFRKYYFKDLWKRKHDRRQELEQQAYYGGRAECIRRGEEILCYEYDVNSAYLSVMRDCVFPDMSKSRYIENGANWQKYWRQGYQMIMRCKVVVPDCYLPVLPHRINGKLCFPTGIFEGTWTSVELAEAIKRGTKILECYEFVYYSQSKPYFREYAKDVWSKRKRYKEQGNKGMDLMIKKIGNSLYGKFAQRNEVGQYSWLWEEYDGILPDKFRIETDERGREWLIIKGEEEPAEFYFPAIAAFITSYCRLKLFEGIKANEESVIYYDTDSLKLTEPAKGIPISEELGEWSYEGSCIASFYRPKMYGKKRKGVPRRAELVYEDENEEHYVFDKPLREREALRRKETPNKWVRVYKVIKKHDDKRLWNESKTDSKPIKIEGV